MTLTAEERARILREREQAMRQAVASARIQPKSSKDVLSERQRQHVQDISRMLAEGQNPYEAVSGAAKDQGGLQQDRQAVGEARMERSESRIRELEAKWQARTAPTDEVPYLDDVDFGPTLTVERDPNKLYCSFCGKEVDRVRATFGSGQIRKKITSPDHVFRDKEGNILTFTEKITHFAEKLVACPDCCLHIQARVKPTVSKVVTVEQKLRPTDSRGIALPTAQTRGVMVTRQIEVTVTRGGDMTNKGAKFDDSDEG